MTAALVLAAVLVLAVAVGPAVLPWPAVAAGGTPLPWLTAAAPPTALRWPAVAVDRPASGGAVVVPPVGHAGNAAARGGSSTDEDGSDAPWVWPTGTRVVERGWEAPADDYAAGHRGIDVDAAVGTPAVAVADGVVSFAGSVAGRGVVSIDHGDGLVSTLDSVTPLVAAGDTVHRGDPVGTVAAGHCSAEASCVHLGARVDGRYVDPVPYLPVAAWPVLLPDSAWPG